MKKITTLFLAFIMLLCSTSGIAAEDAAAAEQKTNTEIKRLSCEQFEALNTMGLLGEEMAEMAADGNITRAQFAGNLFRIAGYPLITYKSGDCPFIDLNPNMPYFNEICALYKMGLGNGTSANTFTPGGNITYAQAVKLTVDVLGYRDYTAVRYGEFPFGYIATATELKLSKGMENTVADTPLTAEDAVKLLYNAGRTKVMHITGIDSEAAVSYQKSKTELLAYRHKIYYDEGIMKSNGIFSLSQENPGEGVTMIDSRKLVSAEVDFSELIGCKVKYFYRSDESGDTLLWAAADSRFEVLNLRADRLAVDAAEYTLNNIVYYDENGKKESARIDSMADVVYNNAIYPIVRLDMLKPESGKLRLIDNDGDEDYDTVIIENFTNLFVAMLYPEMTSIGDKYNQSVCLDDYKTVKIIKDGKLIDITEIGKNVVLSCVVDDSKEKLFIYVSSDVFQGTLKEIRTDERGLVYEFDGGAYRLAAGYQKIVNDGVFHVPELKIGASYRCYLDKAGEIAEIEALDNSGMQYAFLMDMQPDNELFAGNDVAMRLLMKDGSKITAYAKKKIILNGSSVPAGKLLEYSGLKNAAGEIIPQVVQVSFNTEGDVKEFNFAVDNKENPYGYDKTKFTLDCAKSAYYEVNSGCRLFDERYTVNTMTTVFIKYTNLGDKEPYGVSNGGAMGSSGTLWLDLYDADENLVPAVAVRELNMDYYWLEGYMLVDKISEIGTDEGSLKQVSGPIMGIYRTFTEYEQGAIPGTLKKGDVIRISHVNERVKRVEVLLEINETNRTPFVNGGFRSDNCFVFAPVYAVNMTGIVTVNPDELVASSGKLLGSNFRSNAIIPVAVYDLKNDEISIGDVNSLQQLYTPDKNGDLPIEKDSVMVVIRRRYGLAEELIAVRY